MVQRTGGKALPGQGSRTKAVGVPRDVCAGTDTGGEGEKSRRRIQVTLGLGAPTLLVCES